MNRIKDDLKDRGKFESLNMVPESMRLKRFHDTGLWTTDVGYMGIYDKEKT